MGALHPRHARIFARLAIVEKRFRLVRRDLEGRRGQAWSA
jgi:hypothetical protein